MKKIIFIILIAIYCTFLYSASSFGDSTFGNRNNDFLNSGFTNSNSFLFDSWLVYTTFNFEVYYYDFDCISDLADKIEDAYSFILNNFNSFDMYVFNKKTKIYVYKTKEDYYKNTGGGHWSGGCSNLLKNTIYTFEQKDIMRNVILHEMTHLVFDSYMGYPRNMGISWLHEGLAVFMEKEYFGKKWNLKYLKDQGKNGNLKSLKDAFKTATYFEKNVDNISLWYLQVATVVYYMNHVKQDGFKIFCDNLKKYKNVEEALKYTYPWDFKTIDEFDKSWRTWLYSQGDYI